MTPPGKTAAEPTVFVVDDDAAMCESLACLLGAARLPVKTYASAEAFLADYRQDQPGCLVLDVRMRGMSGLELQQRLRDQGAAIPIIIISGHGDIPMAVGAIKSGAVDFLEKPVSDHILLERIRNALALDSRQRQARQQHKRLAARLASLTRRERQVMDLVVAGKPNKQIAAQLGVTPKTVEVHRQRVLDKVGVRNAVELTNVVLTLRSHQDQK